MSIEAERQAVEQLFVKVTLPIIVQDKGRFGIVGTATLFTIQDRPFLITAGHTILDYSVDRWAYSEHPTGGTIYTLGALHHHRPSNGRYDAAVVEILDPNTKERLRTNWRFLTLEQVSLPHEGAEFFVSGYPSALAIPEKTAVRGVLLTLETRRIAIPSDATKLVDPEADYFFDAGPNVFSGEYADLEIHGMSGSAVGEFRSVMGPGLWMPDQAIHVVAVQTAMRKQRYIRAASWATVVALLEGVEPGLAGALRQRLASTK
jgi:hypothetical protein